MKHILIVMDIFISLIEIFPRIMNWTYINEFHSECNSIQMVICLPIFKICWTCQKKNDLHLIMCCGPLHITSSIKQIKYISQNFQWNWNWLLTNKILVTGWNPYLSNLFLLYVYMRVYNRYITSCHIWAMSQRLSVIHSIQEKKPNQCFPGYGFWSVNLSKSLDFQRLAQIRPHIYVLEFTKFLYRFWCRKVTENLWRIFQNHTNYQTTKRKKMKILCYSCEKIQTETTTLTIATTSKHAVPMPVSCLTLFERWSLWESWRIDAISKKRRVTSSEKQMTFFKYPASLLNVYTIFSSGW